MMNDDEFLAATQAVYQDALKAGKTKDQALKAASVFGRNLRITLAQQSWARVHINTLRKELRKETS